jgi:adenylate cyclase
MVAVAALGKKCFQSSWITSVIVGVLIGFGIIGLRSTGVLEPLELGAYDWYLSLRPKTSVAGSRIVLIGITEEDISRHKPWPLSDAILARGLEQLVQDQPRGIGLDLYRDIPSPPGSDALNAVLVNHPSIIVPTKLGTGPTHDIPPPAVLQGTEQVSFNDILIDPGGIVRRGLLFLDNGETTMPSFALRLALLYLQAEEVYAQPDDTHPAWLRLGPTTNRQFAPNDGSYVEADAGGYQVLLDFRDAPEAIPVFSLTALLAGQISPETIAGKVVLLGLGVTAESVKDFFFTPYSRGRGFTHYMPGIALHALIISQLLRASLDGEGGVATVGEGEEWGWILLWSVLGGVLGRLMYALWRFLLIALSGLLLLSALTYSVFVYGWWIPVIPPALGWLISAAVVTAYMSNYEKQHRTILMQLFGQYVSPAVAETIWQQRDQWLHGGRPRSQRLVASVLFSDLVGFTTVSEKLDPQTLTDWLNEYLEAMTPYVIRQDGVILKYIGDGIMAAFGVPLARETEAAIRQDAVHAVQCAMAMARQLAELNRRWGAQGWPMIGMRIGIYTGPVTAGSTGGTERLEYNVHGDTVNTASRLENFDKHVFLPDFIHDPCRILIGEATHHYLNHHFLTQGIGTVRLKGKEQEVLVYRVIGLKDDQMALTQEE